MKQMSREKKTERAGRALLLGANQGSLAAQLLVLGCAGAICMLSPAFRGAAHSHVVNSPCTANSSCYILLRTVKVLSKAKAHTRCSVNSQTLVDL